MITTPTTFVVGAGASKDYGLPTSAELRQEAHELVAEHDAYQLIHSANLCTPEKLNTVLDDLRKHGTDSIDDFMYDRQNDALAMKVGRALIAVLLGSKFSAVDLPDSLGAEDLDWLGYIIKMMRADAPNCKEFVRGNAEVRFVTFNFDSIIEDRFEKAIRNLYKPNPEKQLKKAVNAIHKQIIHVHGRLTPPPGWPLPDHFFRDLSKWIIWLNSALSEIRVVVDPIEDDTSKAAQEAVKRSKILCFLGFAYARNNLAKLGLPMAHDLDVNAKRTYRRIFGTAFGMRPGETDSAVGRLVNSGIGSEKEHCLDFLRNHHILRR